jgi:hypothetical protein
MSTLTDTLQIESTIKLTFPHKVNLLFLPASLFFVCSLVEFLTIQIRAKNGGDVASYCLLTMTVSVLTRTDPF